MAKKKVQAPEVENLVLDKINSFDNRPRSETVYIMRDDDTLVPVKAVNQRDRTIRVGGRDYEHTHENDKGEWIYRAL